MCRPRARYPSGISREPPHRAPDRAARVGNARRRGPRQPAANDDRASPGCRDDRRGDPGRHPHGPQARRRLRAAAVRHPARRRGPLSGIRTGDGRRGCDGARLIRCPRPRPRRAGRAGHRAARRRHDQHAQARELADRACGVIDARIGRPASARAAARRWVAARRPARRARDERGAPPRVVGAAAPRRCAVRARRGAAGRRGRGDRVGRGRRRHAAPGGSRADTGVVCRRSGRRHRGDDMAAVNAALARALLRLFAVQGSYNYERMLGVGVGVAEEPLLRDLADGKYRAAVARGAHFFNAHPYLVGLAIGAAARAEHEGASPDQIERLREALCGPLGSLGDRLVWAGWLPFLSGLALAGVALGAGWIAVGSFLVVYNIGHVALRWWGLKAGWTHGRRVSVALHHPFLQRAGAVLGPAMAFAVGAALPQTAAYLSGPFDPWARVALAVVAALGFLALRLRGDRLNGLRLALGISAVALIIGLLWP